MEHALKCWPDSFDAIAQGIKTFEWRRDDRGFEVDDILVLYKWDPVRQCHIWEDAATRQHAKLRVRVTYILRDQFDMPAGYCVMGIEPEYDVVPPSAGQFLRGALATNLAGARFEGQDESYEDTFSGPWSDLPLWVLDRYGSLAAFTLAGLRALTVRFGAKNAKT